MKWWIGLAAALYPRSWRAEFGQEFRAVLDDVKPSWRVFRNVLKGAIEMRMMDGSNWTKLVAAMAVVGAIVGLGVSFWATPVYMSSATVSLTPAAGVVREQTLQRLYQMETALLSRSDLASIINDPRLVLYRAELRREPLEDVVGEMRRNIRIQEHPSTGGGVAPVVFSISFSYPDPEKAQSTVRVMAAKFIEMNLHSGRDIAAILAPASPPVKEDPNRIVFLAWGLGMGALLGLLTAFVVRWPRHARRMAGFATAGCLFAGAASFLIANRYTSTAVMEISPAPLTAISAISAGEFLQQMAPDIFSSATLSKVIEDRRLNLYSKERATEPMAKVIERMRSDLHIAPLNPASAFSISFTYPDRFKAQLAVTMIIGQFEYLNQRRGMAQNFRQQGEVLDVVDIASLPIDPVYPNRSVIAVLGLLIGVLIGAITLRFRKPGTPAFAEPLDNELQTPSVQLRSVLNRIVTAG